MKYHIEKNSVQETLVIPLFGRLVCSEHFPEFFSDVQDPVVVVYYILERRAKKWQMFLIQQNIF